MKVLEFDEDAVMFRFSKKERHYVRVRCVNRGSGYVYPVRHTRRSRKLWNKHCREDYEEWLRGER